MRFKDRFLAQMVICLAIFAAARGAAMINQEDFARIRDNIKAHIEKNYSIEEVKEAGAQLVEKLTQAPAVLTSVVVEANQYGQFSAPIDQDSDEQVQAVHATAGGTVIYAGIDSQLGVCIRIQHQNKISTYGNMYTLTAVTGERVKKGDIIGTFDRESGKEFYYQLEDSML